MFLIIMHVLCRVPKLGFNYFIHGLVWTAKYSTVQIDEKLWIKKNPPMELPRYPILRKIYTVKIPLQIIHGCRLYMENNGRKYYCYKQVSNPQHPDDRQQQSRHRAFINRLRSVMLLLGDIISRPLPVVGNSPRVPWMILASVLGYDYRLFF